MKMEYTDRDKKIFPVCFCVDRSAAMGTRVIHPQTQRSLGTRLELCIQGISRCFQTAASEDGHRMEAAIVVFADRPHILRRFSVVSEETVGIAPVGPDRPYTGLGEAVKLSLQLLEEQKTRYEAAGVACTQPLLVFVTAARENHGDTDLFERLKEKLRLLIQQEQLDTRIYAASPGASLELLKRLFPGTEPTRVEASQLPQLLADIVPPSGERLHTDAASEPAAGQKPGSYIMHLWDI